MHTLAINLAHVGAWASLCEFNGPQTIKCLKNLKNLFKKKKKKNYFRNTFRVSNSLDLDHACYV